MKIITRQTSFEDEREANIKLCPGLKLKPLKLAIFQPVNAQIEISSLFTNNLILSPLFIQNSLLRGWEGTLYDLVYILGGEFRSARFVLMTCCIMHIII